MVLSAEAQSAREEVERVAWTLAAMPGATPRLKAALGKWPGLFARMGLIFHLIEGADANARGVEGKMLAVLAGQTARAAAGYLLNVLLPHLVRADAIMFETVQTDHAKWIAGYILADGIDRLTRRDIMQDYRELRSPEEANTVTSVMDSLEAVGWVRPEPRKNHRDRVAAWLINPKVHTRFSGLAEAERGRRAAKRERIAEAVRQRRAGNATD